MICFNVQGCDLLALTVESLILHNLLILSIYPQWSKAALPQIQCSSNCNFHKSEVEVVPNPTLYNACIQII